MAKGVAFKCACFAVIVLGLVSPVHAGKVILGGDDLTDHGSRSGSANIEGWLYIQKAIAAINPSVTRPGPFTVDIAAIGSANPGAGVYPSGDAGGAINSVANVLGLTVAFYDGTSAISGFFTSLGTGAVNPRILWIAGTGADNDIDSTEGPVIAANAASINAFVTSGGGLMAHGSGTDAYGWLTALLPGLLNVSGCDADPGATLTAAGIALFPGLSNSDINAGPCHSHFEGTFGALAVLALDGGEVPRAFILGGDLSGGGFTGGGCPHHTSGHGHSGTSPTGHIGNVSGQHHGQHGHTIATGCPPHAFGHKPGLMPETGELFNPSALSGEIVGAVNEDGSLNGNSPAVTQAVGARRGSAKRGTVLQLFATAGGLSSNLLLDVYIGDVQAKVLFSGPAPELTGAWQINVLIPDNAPAAPAVHVRVLFDGYEPPSIDIGIE